jgi:hypothetical protein
MATDLTTAVAAFLMQVGARHITFEMTDAQRKLMQNPLAKGMVLFAMFYITTRNIIVAGLLVVGYFLLTMVLLNENHALNIYSRPWLKQHGFAKSKASGDGHGHAHGHGHGHGHGQDELPPADAYKHNIQTLM